MMARAWSSSRAKEKTCGASSSWEVRSIHYSKLLIHNCELCLITVVVANAAAIWSGGVQDAGVVALKAVYNGKEVSFTIVIHYREILLHNRD